MCEEVGAERHSGISVSIPFRGIETSKDINFNDVSCRNFQAIFCMKKKLKPYLWITTAIVLTTGLLLSSSNVPNTYLDQEQESPEPKQTDELPKRNFKETTIDSDSRYVSVLLSDDKAVTIQLKQHSPLEYSENGKINEIHDKLATEAEDGNTEAAAQLANELSKCSIAPRTSYDLDKALAQLKEERTFSSHYGSGNRVVQVTVSPTYLPATTELIRKRYNECSGISDGQLSNLNKWLSQAAKGGDTRSLHALLRIHGRTPEAFSLMKSAWDAGYVSNGYGIAQMLALGIGESGYIGEPQYISAYAYALITNQVWGKAYEINNSPVSGNRITDMEQALQSSFGNFMTSQEIIEAENLAVTLLRQNGNCCIGGWNNFGLTPSN